VKQVWLVSRPKLSDVAHATICLAMVLHAELKAWSRIFKSQVDSGAVDLNDAMVNYTYVSDTTPVVRAA